jgi:uncharacterized protein (UPF0333 family)
LTSVRGIQTQVIFERKGKVKMSLRKHAPVWILAVAMVGTTFGVAETAQEQSPKQDMKDAGHSTKSAAKDTGRATKKTAKNTGHAVKHGTKKAANKTAQKTREGADKVEDKTNPN